MSKKENREIWQKLFQGESNYDELNNPQKQNPPYAFNLFCCIVAIVLGSFTLTFIILTIVFAITNPIPELAITFGIMVVVLTIVDVVFIIAFIKEKRKKLQRKKNGLKPCNDNSLPGKTIVPLFSMILFGVMGLAILTIILIFNTIEPSRQNLVAGSIVSAFCILISIIFGFSFCSEIKKRKRNHKENSSVENQSDTGTQDSEKIN